MIGEVVEALVVPTKHAGLTGSKLLLVDVGSHGQLVAVDNVGAGVGDGVLVATGSHAVALVLPGVPTDAVVVGLLRSSA